MRKGRQKVTPPKSLAPARLIYAVVSLYPGILMIDLSKKIGKSRGHTVSLVKGMDVAGFFLSEDRGGGLYPFRRIDPREALLLWRQIWN
jgi:hypothetical protein